MARAKKLTPTIIKKIIAEEKRRLEKLGLLKEKRTRKKRTSSKKVSLSENIKKSKIIKKYQISLAKKIKKLQEHRRKLKTKILKEI